jgi:hypothetical protein
MDDVEVVEDGVLRRTVKSDLKLRGAGLRVPHDHSWVRKSDRKILVAGDRTQAAAGDAAVLTEVWRAVFHARIHIALDELIARGALTTTGIRERIDAIGQTEFDEIRSVLRQEHLLVPPADEQVIYLEFVALFCELEAFAPRALELTFPALHDLASVRATVRRDVDPEALLVTSRPAKAPERPVVAAVQEADPYEGTGKLEFADRSARKDAAKARKKGNLARASIYAARAADMPAARTDLDGLVARLAKTLAITDPAQTTGWVDALLPVVQFAGTQQLLRLNVGARLLFDLQAACTIAEREVKVVDVMGWVLSFGKQKVVRSLPATREVRIAKHLRHASEKVAECELEHPEDRDRLAEVLHQITKRGETNVRDVIRPKIEAALDEVDLHPRSLPERVAEKKLIDELLDRATEVGRLTLGDLRDAISKNDLKMPDLSLTELKSRDQLLALDKILSRSLDGVYRSGEIYLRFLQKMSSIVFGTWAGRLLTLYLFLPLLGSLAVIEGLQHMVGPLVHKIWGFEPQISTPMTRYGFAAFLFLLLHVRPIRRVVWWIVRMIGRALRFVLWTIPITIWTHPIVRAYMTSTVHRWLVRPALVGAIVLPFTDGYARWIVAGSVFVLVAVTFNSRLGRRIEEQLTDWLVLSGRQFTTRIVPGLVKWILEVFGKLADVVDRALYRVDELLRFRQGQSAIKLVIKGALGTVWFVIAYVLRLYVDLFIEPTTNPIKHFPVVTVAAKIMIPVIPSILSGVTNALEGILGPGVAAGFAGFTVLVLPGLAGFLVWELKENWKLYRASRPPTLGPLVIGHHGETMVGFLKPGFHSGTIPKLFTKLRRAAWRGDEKGIAKQHEGLHHVEESIAKFVDRQLVSMLVEVEAFGAKDVALARIDIGSNRVQMTIICPSVGSTPATIRFELQSGWIVGAISEPGWTSQLAPKQRRIFEIALAGFYKFSGVELLREQLEHALASEDAPAPPYDIADEGLIVWPGDGFATEAIYDLHGEKLTPVVRGASYDGALYDLGGRHALFGREPLYWSVWSTTWQQIARGEEPMPIIVGPSLLRAASA